MSQAGWKWFCKKCGFDYYGENPPNECPKCHCWDSFTKVIED